MQQEHQVLKRQAVISMQDTEEQLPKCHVKSMHHICPQAQATGVVQEFSSVMQGLQHVGRHANPPHRRPATCLLQVPLEALQMFGHHTCRSQTA